MPASIKDIAQQAGVSTSTVSRVINGKDRVSADTRERVNVALNEHDYKPNEMARVLRGKRSKTIGAVVSDISNNFFARIIKGAENAAREKGYNILICNTDSDPSMEKENVDLLLSKHVSGIIMASVSFKSTFEEQENRGGVPFVYIDNLPKHTADYTSVSINNVLAAQQLTEHLISRGHKNIAILAGSLEESSGMERLEGWKKAMAGHSLPTLDCWITSGAFTIESGFRCTEELLVQKTRPTAILATNNFLAFGAVLALRRYGYNVPDDVSLAAFDINDETQLIVPKITSMNQPVIEFGQTAVELCLRQVQQNGRRQYEQITMPHVFVEGESVAYVKDYAPAANK